MLFPSLTVGGVVPRFHRVINAGLLILLAVAPVAFLSIQMMLWVRDIPNWDEFDTVLGFALDLDAARSLTATWQQFAQLQNEHRTVLSRGIFACSYWLTGGVNFSVLAVLGDLFLVGVGVVVVLSAWDAGSRLRLGAVFALAVFHLLNHEVLFWSGASIDHLMVVFFAVATLRVLAVEARWSLPVACVLGAAATLSLLHGALVWPVGAVLLWLHRPGWRRLVGWSVTGAVVIGLFLVSFHVNPGHRLPGWSDLPGVLVNGLALLGGAPAFGNRTVAPWLGMLFCLAVALLWRRRPPDREHWAWAIVLWCVVSLGAIAWGRSLLFLGDTLTSRYLVLSAMAWALPIWIAVERCRESRIRGIWCAAPILVVLLAFNVSANVQNLEAGEAFAQVREAAVLHYHRFGSFTGCPRPIYPLASRADLIVSKAAARGIYAFPVPEPMHLSRSEETGDATYYIEAVEAAGSRVYVRGWAYRPASPSDDPGIGVVFRAEDRFFAYEARPRSRPDVAAAHQRSEALHSGFELALPPGQLPAGRYQIGVGFSSRRGRAYTMTASTLTIANPGEASVPPRPPR